MAEPTAQSSIDIAAPPALVYELVSNVPEMPLWAVEADKCVWIDGADGPVVGARFRGRNEHRGRRWATICEVTEADPPRRFGFKVRVAKLPSALWRYDIEPTDAGCRVTESTRRLTPRLVARLVNRVLFGIRDRDVHNQRNIERTLAQLKEYAESAAADRPA